jgi:hypothetical protein
MLTTRSRTADLSLDHKDGGPRCTGRRARPPDIFGRRLLLGTTAIIFASSACSGTSEAPAAAPFSVVLPAPPPLSRGDIDGLLAALAGRSGAPPPALPISASVFALNSAAPDTGSAEWTTLMRTLRTARQSALAHGWHVAIAGYTDESGSLSFNKRLSTLRAQSTLNAVVALGYPRARVHASGQGVGGNDDADRRVVVRFVHAGSNGAEVAS